MELTKMGYAVFRANVGKVKTADGRWFDSGLPVGFTDLFAIKDGEVAFIEVKSATGKVRADQENFIKQMRERYGCKAGVARSVEEAKEIMEV